MPEVSDTMRQNRVNDCTESGITIHTADTALGTVHFTVDGFDAQENLQGRIWTDGPMTVNRTEYQLFGRYTVGDGYWETKMPGYQRIRHDAPVVWFSGYPGLCREDRREVTDNARHLVMKVLGAAIHARKTDALVDEAIANEREIAARSEDSDARAAYREAARYLKLCEEHEAKAAKIRAGGDYPKPKH